MSATQDQSPSHEERVLLAVEAFRQGQFQSVNQAAEAYDVPQSTVSDRLHGLPSRRDAQINNRKLTPTEEASLVQWILSMDERGMPPTVAYTRRLANLLLSERDKDPVGENWVRNFVRRHDEIKAKYCRKYDYQRAKCEDPQVFQEWFDRVLAIKQKYGILDEDIYNFDETGFQMGVISTAKVLTRSDRRGRPIVIQPGNREWVTIIESVNVCGWSLPAMVIFQGKLHQASWYESGVPSDWHIGVSDNGWSTVDLGFTWLKELYDPYTRRRTVGKYRLLILDGHGSHVSPEFDNYCEANSIKVVQMPAHSSHYLQPLDVGCYAPLKIIYGRLVQEKMLAGVNHIDKQEFLPLYLQARQQALSPANIKSGFKATGLFPLDPNQALSRLQIKSNNKPVNKPVNKPRDHHTPSPLKSPNVSKTSYNINQLVTHTERLLQHRPQNPDSPVSQAIGQLIKGCEIAMHGALFLADENRQLRSESQWQKKKKEQSRIYVANGGTLTVAEGVARARQRREEEGRSQQANGDDASNSKRRAPGKCSKCGSLEHNARMCSN